MNGWMNGWTNGICPHSTGLCPLSGLLPKKIILVSLVGVASPLQELQNLVGMVPVGANFCSHISSKTRGKKGPACEIIVNWLSFSQKKGVITRGGFTPRTPKIGWGWFLWVPTYAHKSTLRHGEKICPVYEIQESNNQVLVKK